MRPRTILAAAVLALAANGTASAQGLISVDIIDTPRPVERWGYAPRVQRVAPGSWVTWSNSGDDIHTVTATDASFDSAELRPSEGFSFYFDRPGAFEYVCALHDWMMGTIVVGEDWSEPQAPVDEALPVTEEPAEDPQ